MTIKNCKLVGAITVTALLLVACTILAFETNHSTHGSLGLTHYTIQEALDNLDNNNTSHPWLTIRAIEHSGVTFSNDTATNNQIKKWIVQGSIEEDMGLNGTAAGFAEYGFASSADRLTWTGFNVGGNLTYLLYRRAENHFYPALPPTTRLGITIVSTNVTSATNWASQSDLNQRDWTDGINASSDEIKWKSLGHILHIVEDMGVPAHGRRDIHAINKDNFENWAGSNDLTFFDTASPLFANAYRPVKTGLLNITPDLTDIAAFSDLPGAIAGLREYTANNYVSDDTIVKEDNTTNPTIPKLPLNASNTDFIHNSKNIPIVEKGCMYKLDSWLGSSHTAIVSLSVDPETGLLKPGFFKISDSVSEAMWQDIAPRVIAVAAKVIKLYYDPVTWEDGFETYTAGAFPSTNWTADAAGGSVDNTVAYTGSQSLKMVGVIGGCWGGLAYRALQTTAPYTIELYLRNGSEALSGCHPDRGYVGLRKGTSWTNPSRVFIYCTGTGTMQFRKVDGTILATSAYTTLTWYKIKIKYERPDASTVKISYWLNDVSMGVDTGTKYAEEDNLTNIDLTCSEGSVWFDDVKIFK